MYLIYCRRFCFVVFFSLFPLFLHILFIFRFSSLYLSKTSENCIDCSENYWVKSRIVVIKRLETKFEVEIT